MQCSVPCGGGVQRRLVKCVNTQTGLAEEDSDLCSHEAWPESSRPCATEDCELVEPPRECLLTLGDDGIRGEGWLGTRESSRCWCQDSCCSIYSWLKPHGHRNWEATGCQGPKLGISQGESQLLRHPAASFVSPREWKEPPDLSCGKLFSPGS